jgi:primase-polymerase (primpol)-like protein
MPFANTIPDDLHERDQWVLWRYEDRNGLPTKVPYQPGGQRASSTDPKTWSSFETVRTEWERASSRYVGPGFVFSKDDPYSGVDLDDALDSEGGVKPWAQGIVSRFSDSYMEISPSGAGLKIWVKASLPSNVPGVKVGDGQIELYDHARYFAVTGRVFRGAPLEIEDHAADIIALYERLVQPKVRSWPLQPLDGGRIPFGQQHNTLVSLAGTLRKRRVCDEAIEACLQEINLRQCERPGPRTHITNIVRSSRKWGATG